MKKRVLAALLSVLVTATCLTGCGIGNTAHSVSDNKVDKTDEEENDDEVTYSSSKKVIRAFFQAFYDVDEDAMRTCFYPKGDEDRTDETVDSNIKTAKSAMEYTEFDVADITFDIMDEDIQDYLEDAGYEDYDEAEVLTVTVPMTQTIDTVVYEVNDIYEIYTVCYDDCWYIAEIEETETIPVSFTDPNEDTENAEDEQSDTSADAEDVIELFFAYTALSYADELAELCEIPGTSEADARELANEYIDRYGDALADANLDGIRIFDAASYYGDELSVLDETVKDLRGLGDECSVGVYGVVFTDADGNTMETFMVCPVKYDDHWYIGIALDINDLDEDDTDAVAMPENNTSALGVDFPVCWVDKDNRCFAVNGHMYTLGVSTLQDMIDDGLVFEEGLGISINNTLKANAESGGFEIWLNEDEYWAFQVDVGNYTDEDKTITECPICQVYLPIHPEDEMTDNVLEFAFPLDMTPEECLANAGEPTDTWDYQGTSYMLEYKYEWEGEEYYGNTGYDFEWYDDVLKYVYLTYRP